MSCNTEPTAVPIAVHMMAISAMNSSASGSSSGCAGRKPAARQTRKTMLPWISATVALPSVCPSTILSRDTGATSVSFRKPNWRSQMVSMPLKTAVNRMPIVTMPGARNCT
jgi:hypothetical protein